MIGYIKGFLIDKNVDTILVDVSGVGYELSVPLSTLCMIGHVNQTVELFVYTHVREDTLKLFGFLNVFDKKVFEMVLSVSGIGPKAALSLLGPHDGVALCKIIEHEQTTALTNIPGVGQKTAERIILELKSKCLKLRTRYGATSSTNETKAAVSTKSNNDSLLFDEKQIFNELDRAKKDFFVLIEDLTSALSNLGYKEKQISLICANLEKRFKSGEQLSLDDVLKDSLKKLTEHVLRS